MKLRTFKKGIHPPYSKNLSENCIIETYLPKGDLVFPMNQHIGAPCKPIVKIGDTVLVGQKIGEGSGFVTSSIFSSVSGIVKGIEHKTIVTGENILSVIVENDNNYATVNGLGHKRDYTQITSTEILNIIKESGIVGLGGACFPTHIKLSPPEDKPIDSIIINAAECEPYLTCDDRLILEHFSEILEGIKIVLKLFPNSKAFIGIEMNKKNAFEHMKSKTNNLNNISVIPLKTKYPQGSEKHLIYSITKRQVPSGKLPYEIGCIVLNVATLYQIYDAVVNTTPQLESIITVTGEAISNPKNLRVKVGTSFKEIIDFCGGFKTQPIKIISGGPMMGVATKSLDIPVVKGTSGILCLDTSQMPAEETQCIRCGKCIDVCPMNIVPGALSHSAKKNNLDEFEKLNGMDCIECGCCCFSCPAKVNLISNIKIAKATIIKNRQNRGI